MQDVQDRDLSRLGSVDLFLSTFPCQSFSGGGLGLGAEDGKNGLLVLHSLNYVLHWSPRSVVFENVEGLPQRHPDLRDFIVKTLDDAGYF